MVPLKLVTMSATLRVDGTHCSAFVAITSLRQISSKTHGFSQAVPCLWCVALPRMDGIAEPPQINVDARQFPVSVHFRFAAVAPRQPLTLVAKQQKWIKTPHKPR